MIAAVTQNYSLDKLPFGWFDVVAVVVLGFGVWRGRRNGMTKEVLPTIQWLAIVIVSGLLYDPVAHLLVSSMKLGRTASCLISYLTLAMIIWLGFYFLKKPINPKLTGSNLFGSGEYYLGMCSGMVRYAAMLLFALALLHAPFYSAGELQQQQNYVKRWYGGGLYNGQLIPDFPTAQAGIFKNSFIGSYIVEGLDPLLINTTAPAAKIPSDQLQGITTIKLKN